MSIVEVLNEVCESLTADLGYHVGYIFGSTKYIREELSTLSKSPKTSKYKFPLVALHVPFEEDRTDKDYESKAYVNITIAVNTLSKYTNRERLQKSFIERLRPLYKKFLEKLQKNSHTDFNYPEHVPHRYRERFDFGSDGAMDSNGKPLDDLIDAIEILNLFIKTKKEKCYGNRY